MELQLLRIKFLIKLSSSIISLIMPKFFKPIHGSLAPPHCNNSLFSFSPKIRS